MKTLLLNSLLFLNLTSFGSGLDSWDTGPRPPLPPALEVEAGTLFAVTAVDTSRIYVAVELMKINHNLIHYPIQWVGVDLVPWKESS